VQLGLTQVPPLSWPASAKRVSGAASSTREKRHKGLRGPLKAGAPRDPTNENDRGRCVCNARDGSPSNWGGACWVTDCCCCSMWQSGCSLESPSNHPCATCPRRTSRPVFDREWGARYRNTGHLLGAASCGGGTEVSDPQLQPSSGRLPRWEHDGPWGQSATVAVLCGRPPSTSLSLKVSSLEHVMEYCVYGSRRRIAPLDDP
jgi:hypothetical protein